MFVSTKLFEGFSKNDLKVTFIDVWGRTTLYVQSY